MIDIIGHIKIADQKRFKYLLACIRSYSFLKDHCKFILSIEGLSHEQRSLVVDELREFEYTMSYNLSDNYGNAYCSLLDQGTNPFVINFMEDQFMLIDDKDWFVGLLNTMEQKSVEVCKASFFTIEQNSIKTIIGEQTDYGLVFDNNENNFQEYKKHYGERYYLGVNFITTRTFAYSFWRRPIVSHKPHAYEVCGYSHYLNHKCIIPSREIQCAIDDSHGEIGTSLIERKEEKYDRLISHT